ncbi:MAG TPA: cupin domain-containing protein [Candidatus Dormibacteraeota bacterium]|nr:cupin domain-containing protein [Candidatus Dormibacteraeota bacterium]
MVLRPGAVSRPVKHRTVEEVWYFIAGEGEVWVDDQTQRVSAGSTVVIPTDRPFQFRALGEEPLRFLCFTSPPWPGDDEAIALQKGGLGKPTV